MAAPRSKPAPILRQECVARATHVSKDVNSPHHLPSRTPAQSAPPKEAQVYYILPSTSAPWIARRCQARIKQPHSLRPGRDARWGIVIGGAQVAGAALLSRHRRAGLAQADAFGIPSRGMRGRMTQRKHNRFGSLEAAANAAFPEKSACTRAYFYGGGMRGEKKGGRREPKGEGEGNREVSSRNVKVRMRVRVGVTFCPNCSLNSIFFSLVFLLLFSRAFRKSLPDFLALFCFGRCLCGCQCARACVYVCVYTCEV